MLDGRTIYTVILILYILALLFGRKEQYGSITALFVFGIAFVAFHAESIWDLHNYYAGMPDLARRSLSDFFAAVKIESLGKTFWFYFCSKFHYKGMLPFFTVTVFYGIQLGIVLKTAKKQNIPSVYMVLAVIFLMCSTKYYSVLAGVKNHMAFTVFIASLAGELLFPKNRKMCWAGYLLSVTFHNSMWPLVLLRLLLSVYRRYPTKLIFGGVLIIAPFANTIGELLAEATGWEFLAALSEKAEVYYADSRDGALSLSNMATSWVKMACIFLLLWYAYRLYRKRQWPEGWKPYLDFTLMAALFTLGASGAPDLLVRFHDFLGLLSANILMMALAEGRLQLEQARAEKRKSCIKVRGGRWHAPDFFYVIFLLESGLFFGYQFLGILTKIGWQSPPLLV